VAASRPLTLTLAGALLGGLLGPSPRVALAHDSPEHVVEDLTATMAREGRSATLLYRRAGEFRALGKLDRAAADLGIALEMDPGFVAARVELARIRLSQGGSAEALRLIDRAIEQVPKDAGRAPLYMVRSDVQLAAGDPGRALADCERAFMHDAVEVDWYLRRSRLEEKLGLPERRADGLRAGFERTGSVVLKIEWIEAMIDAGRAPQALVPIEEEMADGRWRASWLIRRARARQVLGRHGLADDDLRAAIAEIDGRISTGRPDASLLADRGLARGLLGDRAAALADLTAARAQRADPWMLARLEALLTSRPDPR